MSIVAERVEYLDSYGKVVTESLRDYGHHIRHWADGGSTCLDNLTLLCRRHHRAVHEGAFTIAVRNDGTPAFYRPDGSCIEIAPAARSALGVALDLHTTLPRADSGPFDVGWAIDVLRDSAFITATARESP